MSTTASAVKSSHKIKHFTSKYVDDSKCIECDKEAYVVKTIKSHMKLVHDISSLRENKLFRYKWI